MEGSEIVADAVERQIELNPQSVAGQRVQMSRPIAYDTLRPEVVKMLQDGRPPTFAYVRLQQPTLAVKNHQYSKGWGIITVNLEHRPLLKERIRYYIEIKKCTIIDWGNFPSPTSKLARAHSSGSAKDPWTEMREFCEAKITGSVSVSREIANLRSAKATLEQETKALRAALKKEGKTLHGEKKNSSGKDPDLNEETTAKEGSGGSSGEGSAEGEAGGQRGVPEAKGDAEGPKGARSTRPARG